MELVFIGYFPKRTALTEDFALPHLVDLCSVSTCIAKGPPDDWISNWQQNASGVFSTRRRAVEAMQGVDPADYAVHAYRMLPLEFDQGATRPVEICPSPPDWAPDQEPLEPLALDYRSLGYDAVELTPNAAFFSCSPLSCNGGWSVFATNEHCLIDDLARAMEIATEFSRGYWEPGPYRVVEVLSTTPTRAAVD